jgi:hypothetical protein
MRKIKIHTKYGGRIIKRRNNLVVLGEGGKLLKETSAFRIMKNVVICRCDPGLLGH